MAKPSEKDRVSRHFDRVRAADRVYDKWAKTYQTEQLVDYYCGQQWRGLSDDEAKLRYVLNLVFPTMETQIPSLMFYRPQVKIEPRPPFADDPSSKVADIAKVCEDTVQTFIDEPDVHFKEHTLLALRDAFWRFGIVEVGYSADWIDNPHAGKPVLKEKSREDDPDEPMVDGKGSTVYEPDKLVESEELYVKRLDPRCFRVSISGRNVLTENDWVGYYEWVYVEDVKRNPKYSNTSTLSASGRSADGPMVKDDKDADRHAGMVKLWKLWDLRTKTRCVLAEGHERYLLEGEAWTTLPFAALKFYERPSEWYPLPPIYNWLSPQDEYNEARQQQKVHRQRFERKYTVYTGGIDDTELEKIQNGGDGTFAKRNTPDDPIRPVEDAPLDGAIWNQVAVTKDDFRQISGTTSEQAGVAASDTATQANIVDMHSRVRESALRNVVGEWLGTIARLMLLTLREKMQLPFWVKRNVDPNNPDPQDAQRVMDAWQSLMAEDLGTTNIAVSVDVTTLSPVSEDAQRNAWTQVLSMLTNPALAMMLGMSEPLLRKTVGYYGIKSERDIAAIAQVLQLMLKMQMAAQAAAAGPTGAPTPAAAGTPGQPAGMPASAGMVQ